VDDWLAEKNEQPIFFEAAAHHSRASRTAFFSQDVDPVRHEN